MNRYAKTYKELFRSFDWVDWTYTGIAVGMVLSLAVTFIVYS